MVSSMAMASASTNSVFTAPRSGSRTVTRRVSPPGRRTCTSALATANDGGIAGHEKAFQRSPANTPPPSGRNTTALISATSRSRPAGSAAGAWWACQSSSAARSSASAGPVSPRIHHSAARATRAAPTAGSNGNFASIASSPSACAAPACGLSRSRRSSASSNVARCDRYRASGTIGDCAKVAMTCSKVRSASPRCFIASCQRPRSSSRPPGMPSVRASWLTRSARASRVTTDGAMPGSPASARWLPGSV